MNTSRKHEDHPGMRMHTRVVGAQGAGFHGTLVHGLEIFKLQRKQKGCTHREETGGCSSQGDIHALMMRWMPERMHDRLRMLEGISYGGERITMSPAPVDSSLMETSHTLHQREKRSKETRVRYSLAEVP